MYEHIYRLVLRLYPRGFRKEFGEESLLLIRDRWRDEAGFRFRVRLLLDILLDTCRSLIHEHAREESGALAVSGPASVAPAFTLLIDGGPQPAALCGGALASWLALLCFSALLAGNGARPSYGIPHNGVGGLGSWLSRVSHRQQQPHPEFEAASVKPAAQQGIMFVRPLPGRLTANASLQMLMQEAYGLQAFQVAGGPDWSKVDRYAVEATAGSAVTRTQMMLMLQTLLEERFQLRFHRETRELPAFALVTARTPVNLSPGSVEKCAERTANSPSDWSGGIMAPPTGAPVTLPQCAMPRVMLQPGGAQLQGRSIAMTDLARALSLVMERVVIDRTGISGKFDIDLNFLPDDTTAAMPPPPPGMAATLEMKTPTILAALQEQLGLRLESTRGPVEVLVVDRAARPPQ